MKGKTKEIMKSKMKDKTISLYVHIPFCKSKCHYCDFNSYACMEGYMEDYFKSMRKELEHHAKELEGQSVKTIFIGGGTPSVVDEGLIADLMAASRNFFTIQSDAEVTIETNPGTLTLEKLHEYRSSGINRISMGLQAWQNSLLREIGRIHDRAEFSENFNAARLAGFDNINVDLMFALPGQELVDWKETLEEVTLLKPEHISCYSLKIEEGTLFGKLYEKGELQIPDDTLDRAMYHLALKNLDQAGYDHYEISNFCKPGRECRHNLVYWKTEPYIGIGAGAHSCFGDRRFNNPYGIPEYIKAVQADLGKLSIPIETLDEAEKMKEFMILGLRLMAGIHAEEFRERFGRDLFNVYGAQLAALKKKGHIEITGNEICLTPFGLDFANEAFMEFI